MASSGTCATSHPLLARTVCPRMNRASDSVSHGFASIRKRSEKTVDLPGLPCRIPLLHVFADGFSGMVKHVHRAQRRGVDFANARRRKANFGFCCFFFASFLQRRGTFSFVGRSFRIARACARGKDVERRVLRFVRIRTFFPRVFHVGAHLSIFWVPRDVIFASHGHQSHERFFCVFPTRASTGFDHVFLVSARQRVAHLHDEPFGASVCGRLFHVRVARLRFASFLRFGSREGEKRDQSRTCEAHRHRRSTSKWDPGASPFSLSNPNGIPFRTPSFRWRLPLSKGIRNGGGLLGESEGAVAEAGSLRCLFAIPKARQDGWEWMAKMKHEQTGSDWRCIYLAWT